MGKWILRLAILGGLVAAWFVLRSTVFAPRPLEVRLVAAERGRVEATVTNTRAGTVRARRRAELSPETSGRVVALPYAEGDRVEAGAIVVRLDSSQQEAQVELTRRALETAAARHDEACIVAARTARELERNAPLAEKQLISSDSFDAIQSAHERAVAACASTTAAVGQARAELALYENELARTVMRAPFAGVLAEVTVEVGEWLTPSPPGIPIPSVIDLIDTGSIYVSAPMDEVDSAALAAGQRVTVTIDPFPGRSFPGHVARVAPYVLDLEEQNRTVAIEVELDDQAFAATLLPGTSADVEVILEVREDVLRIPTATLLEGGRVLVLADGVLAERQVETGLKNWDWTEVRSGLEAGELVVSSLGVTGVKAGARAVMAAAGTGQ
ncbi:MAG: efflux RND transporter periplasmic adaptor subunit [Planctomycetota bacterium]